MRTLLRIAIMVLVGFSVSGCAFFGADRQPPPLAPGKGSIVDTARSQIGVRYRRAGESPREGFDCSGFVQWVYARHGIRLPRRTDDQIRTGQRVSKSALRPGDLVFFMPSARSGDLHVGIFDGHGGFIHSPSPGGRVREDSLLAPYWRTTYYAANRVTP